MGKNMDQETKEKLQKDIELAEEELRKVYAPYKDKIKKELANIWYEILWSEKMPPEKRTFTDARLKELRKSVIAALQEKREQEEEKLQKNRQYAANK